MELKDDSPCCSLWKAKYAKLQQKYTRAEEGRSALKEGLALFESGYNKMKEDYEKEKMHTDNERNDKEKESAARVSLENEILSLKPEVLSLSQKGSSVPENVDEELKLLQGLASEQEMELKHLQEEKKKAKDALESSKAEKNTVDQELSKLKAQLLKVETEKKQLKKDLQKEKARADSEKKRADEVLKTANTEQAELEVLKAVKININDLSSTSEDKSLETEIARLKELIDKEKERAELEKKRTDEALKTAKTEQAELEVLKAVKNNINDLYLKSEDKSLEMELGRLKELLDKEKKRADIETKKAEIEKKNTNKLEEMLKSEQGRADEQKRLVDVERKKADELAHQLQKLKREADEAKSKLVLEGSKFRDANNKKINAERKKTIKEKKKAEEQQKLADMSTKHALEEKQRADMFKQQAMSEKAHAVKLAKELEDTKQRTKKASTELANPSAVLVQKDLEAISTEIKLLKKRLRLKKERVKHADKVAEFEKKCKKVVEEELHQLKLEFARFFCRGGLCNCFSVGKSFLEKDGNVNLKRKFCAPCEWRSTSVDHIFYSKLKGEVDKSGEVHMIRAKYRELDERAKGLEIVSDMLDAKSLESLSLSDVSTPYHKKLLNDSAERGPTSMRRCFKLKQPAPQKKPEDLLIEPFQDLTEDDKELVSNALSNASRRKVLVTHENSNITITGEVLRCLRPGAWLNNEVINLYLELLKERERKEPKKFLKCHFFNTFFYKKLIGGTGGYDYKSVRRWTSQRKLGYSLLDCEKIFVPVHKEIHWCLAVINKKEKKFQYLDSLGGVDRQVMGVLEQYIVDEVKDKNGEDIDVTSWKQEFVTDLPNQQNGFDCGVFMIKYADFYSRDTGLCFTQKDMPYFRLRTAKEILKLRAD